MMDSGQHPPQQQAPDPQEVEAFVRALQRQVADYATRLASAEAQRDLMGARLAAAEAELAELRETQPDTEEVSA